MKPQPASIRIPQPELAGLVPSRRALSAIALMLLAVSVLAADGTSPSASSGNTNKPVARPYLLHPEYGVGYWIWTDRTFDQQTCRFLRTFEIPRTSVVNYARIRMTADNSYRLFLDGREIGKGGEWRSLNEHEVTSLLGPGPHVMAVEVFSDYGPAGVVFGLHAELAGGQTIEIGSDENCRIIPDDQKDWETCTHAEPGWKSAQVMAAFVDGPWRLPSVRVVQGPSLQPIVLKFWQTAWFQITLLSVCSIAVLVSVYLMSQLATQSKAQRFLQRERARIARDIHDDVGARLTQLVLLGERAQNDLPAEAKMRGQINQMCERTREVLGAIDEVIWTVNSRRDTVHDFETYVCNYAEAFLQSSSIRCRLDVDADIPEGAFDLAIRRNLFLAIKEALHNAVKYSGATELFLRIHSKGKEIIVTVEDDGRGFHPTQASEQRNGLHNMSQRIAEVGGKCHVTSRPGHGCRVEFRTPLVHARDARQRWWQWRWKRRKIDAGEHLHVTASAPFGGPVKS